MPLLKSLSATQQKQTALHQVKSQKLIDHVLDVIGRQNDEEGRDFMKLHRAEIKITVLYKKTSTYPAYTVSRNTSNNHPCLWAIQWCFKTLCSHCIKRHVWSCISQQMSLFTIPTVDTKIFCVNLCLRGIIRCTSPWKDKHGQGQRKIFFRIAFKRAEELGLIYECISTIHLKICNVCAAWQEKKVRVMWRNASIPLYCKIIPCYLL